MFPGKVCEFCDEPATMGESIWGRAPSMFCEKCYTSLQPKPPKYTKIIWTFKVDRSVWYDPVRCCTKGVYNLTEAELEEKCCVFDGELYWKDSIPLSLQ